VVTIIYGAVVQL